MTTKNERPAKLRELLPQLTHLLGEETDLIANLANCAGALKQQCDYWWVGFYLIREEELVLGPFQGPVACTRIAHGRGVCGSAWAENRTIVVPDVREFPGHIACNAHSTSEVVIPVVENGEVRMVLDIDSRQLDDFSVEEVALLEEVAGILQGHLYD